MGVDNRCMFATATTPAFGDGGCALGIMTRYSEYQAIDSVKVGVATTPRSSGEGRSQEVALIAALLASVLPELPCGTLKSSLGVLVLGG
jgi:hypothetical protein